MEKRRKKKILLVINTMGQAGAEMALIELIKKLESMNEFKVYLYSIIPCGELFDRALAIIPDRILNKRYYNYSLNSLKGRLVILKTLIYSFFNKFTGFRLFPYMIKNIKYQRKKVNKLQYDKLLWRLLAEGGPDINQKFDLAVSYIEGGAAYYVADRVKAKSKAAFIHIDYKEAGYRPFMDKACYDKMSRIYVVSNEVGKEFGKIYPMHRDKIRLFRNLLDRDLIIKKAKSGEGFKDDFNGIRLVTVGRLHYQKGYDIAIKALNILINEGLNIRWYIIGDGLLRSTLEEDIKEYKLEDRFILLGKKDNPYPYIQEANIYVHATRFEGKSIAIEEAQILGKAILASNCTGNREQIISEFDGKLFDLNEENLAKEIKELINNKDIIKSYEKNVKLKKLDFPEDLEDMLGLLK